MMLFSFYFFVFVRIVVFWTGCYGENKRKNEEKMFLFSFFVSEFMTEKITEHSSKKIQTQFIKPRCLFLAALFATHNYTFAYKPQKTTLSQCAVSTIISNTDFLSKGFIANPKSCNKIVFFVKYINNCTVPLYELFTRHQNTTNQRKPLLLQNLLLCNKQHTASTYLPNV